MKDHKICLYREIWNIPVTPCCNIFQGALDEIDEEALLAEEDDENDDTRSWRR